jgi:BMFP domain-containing protein YqiC
MGDVAYVSKREYEALKDRIAQLEAALQEIASYEGPDHLLDINAKNMRDTAREALGLTAENSSEGK